MSNPDDDTDVPSGLNDDARMERTSPPPSHKHQLAQLAGSALRAPLSHIPLPALTRFARAGLVAGRGRVDCFLQAANSQRDFELDLGGAS